MTGFAFFVGEDVVVVEVAETTKATFKWEDVFLEFVGWKSCIGAYWNCNGFCWIRWGLLAVYEFWNGFGSVVEIVPDVA